MQSTAVEPADKQAGLNELVAVLQHEEPPKAMLEPPDLHVDLADRVTSAASEVPPPDPALRPAHASKASFGGRVARMLLAVCVGAGAIVGWQSYGEAAREMLATWAPQLVAAAPAPSQAEKIAEQQPASTEAAQQQPAAQPVATAAAAPAAENAVPQPAAAAPAALAPAPELAPMIEDMAREIASLRQTIEQLKTGQQQISRELAKAIEHEPRRKTATPAPKPAVAAPRTPAPPPPRQAYTPPREQQVYVPPREQVYTPPRDQVYTPPPPQVYVPPPPSTYAAPRPPRPLP